MQNSSELQFSFIGVLMTTTPPHDQPAPPGWCRIDPGLDAAATRVPAAFREDSHPQAIFKFQPCKSFDYRVHYEVISVIYGQPLRKGLMRRCLQDIFIGGLLFAVLNLSLLFHADVRFSSSGSLLQL